MSAFANSLGCKVAYNLDGGQSAVMVFGDEICNEKNQGTGRGMSDIVYVQDFTE
jgi:exopolysaccharide biosynthesis protein